MDARGKGKIQAGIGGENWLHCLAAVNSHSRISYGKARHLVQGSAPGSGSPPRSSRRWPAMGGDRGARGANRMAARLGLEPRQTDSESVVLPLHHRAVKPFRPAGATLGESGSPSRRLEPAMGLEPATPCLQNRCSAIELRRRVPPTIGKGNANNNCAASDPGSCSRDWWLPGDSNPEPTD